MVVEGSDAGSERKTLDLTYGRAWFGFGPGFIPHDSIIESAGGDDQCSCQLTASVRSPRISSSWSLAIIPQEMTN
jgi:hypothetical protein